MHSWIRRFLAGAVPAAVLFTSSLADAITVRIDTAEGSFDDDHIAHWLTLSSQTLVRFELSEPAPAGGLDIPTISDMSPQLAWVHFDEGEAESELLFTFQAGHEYEDAGYCYIGRHGYGKGGSLDPSNPSSPGDDPVCMFRLPDHGHRLLDDVRPEMRP
jgi:hypothetical protein